MNDLNSEEIPPHSDQAIEAALVVTDENLLVDNDVGAEDESTSNKVKEAAGLYRCNVCISVIVSSSLQSLHACRVSHIE